MANKLVRKFKSCITGNLTNSYENIWPSKKCSNKLQYRFKKNINIQPFTFCHSSGNRREHPRDTFRRIKIQFHSVCIKHYVSKKMNMKHAAPPRVYGRKTTDRAELTSFRRALLAPIASLQAPKHLDCESTKPETTGWWRPCGSSRSGGQHT